MNERKYPQLWQSYQWWRECSELRKKHNLRINAIERGVSSMDTQFEEDMMETMPWGERITTTKTRTVDVILNLDQLVAATKQVMINFGSLVPVWDWVTSIRGLGQGGLAAQVLAHIDDIEKFSNVSKLWRYSGYGLYDYFYDGNTCKGPKDGWKYSDTKKDENGYPVREFVVNTPKEGWELRHQIDRKVAGWVCPYNTPLKSALYLVGDQFIKQNTHPYREIYDEEKERQATLHPDMAKHVIDKRGRRKAVKIFAQHLWLKWRQAENLPISEPYVQAIMGHSDIITPE